MMCCWNWKPTRPRRKSQRPVSGTIVRDRRRKATVEPGNCCFKIEEVRVPDQARKARRKPGDPQARAARTAVPASPKCRRPSASRMMAENKIVSEAAGTGKRGQVLKGDVIDAINSGSAPAAPHNRQQRAGLLG
jgi:2-oxoglutarate dehydrogenase E2 component (dihydrolipoamide succinyltransferase)